MLTSSSPTTTTVRQVRRGYAPRRRQARKPSPLRYILAFAVAGILLAYATAFLGVMRMRAQVDKARMEVTAMEEQNRRLERKLRYMRSDEYVESVARRELGLVKKGEVLVVIKPGAESKR